MLGTLGELLVIGIIAKKISKDIKESEKRAEERRLQEQEDRKWMKAYEREERKLERRKKREESREKRDERKQERRDEKEWRKYKREEEISRKKQEEQERTRQKQLELEMQRQREQEEEERKQRREREQRRRNSVVQFQDGISREQFYEIVDSAVKTVKHRKITVSIQNAVVTGTVESRSGLSSWIFKLDYNDFGRLTGTYWWKSDNQDSVIPQNIGTYIQNEIVRIRSKQS